MAEQTSSASITEQVFAHLVELAALELAPGEGDYLRRELNRQLKAIRALEAVPLDPGTPVTSHGVPYPPQLSPPPRPDEWIPFTRSEEILTGAPETENGYIVTPDIPHTELE